MHVLVARTAPLDRDNADTDALDGELAVAPLADDQRGDVGVFRAQLRCFVGLDSHADVRTVEVMELDVSPHVVMAHVLESLVRRGRSDEHALVSLAAQLTAQMLHVAEQFPVGTVLESDGDVLQACVPVTAWKGRRPVCDPAGPFDGRR